MGIFGLAIVGVGADLLHSFAGGRYPWTETSLVILEDGGELVVVSAISWFVYAVAHQELSLMQVPSPAA